MKKTNRIIQEIRNDFQRDSSKDSTTLSITFLRDDVYKRFQERGIPELWNKLTNGKIRVKGVYNRDWYSSLGVSGFYTYTIWKDTIELLVFFDKRIVVEELNNRIFHLCPFISVEEITFSHLSLPPVTESSVFGKYRLNQTNF